MFRKIVAPYQGPLLCVCSDKPYYLYAADSSILVPKSTIEIIQISPKYAKRVICTTDQIIPNPTDIQNNLLGEIKLVARHQPIKYRDMTFYITEMDPNEPCLLLQQDTILEIICTWTRTIMDVELFSHLPVLHLYVGKCNVKWPFENLITITCSFTTKDMKFDKMIQEALKYQPCILDLVNIYCLQDQWPMLMDDIQLLQNKSVIMVATTDKDIDDIPGVWITRHFTNSNEVKQDRLDDLNNEFNMKLELDLNQVELKQIKEIAWRHVINAVIPPKEPLDMIVGMENPKKQLEKVIVFPLKYKKLYSSLPTLSKGVLLYGLPGTGKTHLATQFLQQINIPHLIVKGPEILSKYVGETEKNIRQLFQDAQSKAPFVLLFDEIDSLTPRRGHDSSGITDRIVNQFLTALDGSEVLKNVFVIGTTSQPQVIDPALLRPGRLDTHVECTLLDKSEFDDAVHLLSSKYNAIINTFNFVENCTFGDLESSFLKIYFEHVAKHKSNTDLKVDEMVFKSSLTANALNEYKQTLDAFKGKGKKERILKNKDTLA